MVVFLFRLLIAFVVFSLLIWLVRVVGTLLRRPQVRRGDRRDPLRRRPRAPKERFRPPDDVIDVPYEDVSEPPAS